MKRLVTAATAAVAVATLISTLTAQTKKPAASAMVKTSPALNSSKGFTVVEATIPEIQAALKSGRVSGSGCTKSCCTRRSP
jgi:hypothetical protein